MFLLGKEVEDNEKKKLNKPVAISFYSCFANHLVVQDSDFGLVYY